MSIIVVLLVLMIIGAIIAIETPNLLSSIVAVGGVGFMMSIAYLFLGAPEIAITQLVVEVLCLIVLIRATINKDLTTVSGDREFFGLTIAAVVVIAIALIIVRTFTEFPIFGNSVLDRIKDSPSATYLATGYTETGSHNIVTSIILGFRAYDTLAVSAVLFCAVFGALSILRKTARKNKDEIDLESSN